MPTSGGTATVIAVIAAIVLVVAVPVVTLLSRVDNVTQENVNRIVSEFVTDVKNTGVLTTAKYQDFQSKLNATGNTYKIDMEIQHLDENPGKKLAQANYTKVGENVYWSEYTSQIEAKLLSKTTAGETITLKQGDIIYVGVSNSNSTAAQDAKSSLLNFSNSGEEAISANDSGMVNTDGQQ